MNGNYGWSPSSAWGMRQWGQVDPLSHGMGGATPQGVTPPDSDGFQVGWNMPTFQMGLQGLNTIGNLWGAWQANKLARDQLNFTKDFANRNLANQTQAYNTALEDRGRSRAAVEGQTSAEAQAYIDRNRLPDRG